MKTIITGSKTIQSYDVVAKAILDSTFSDRITSVFTTQEPGPPIFGYRWAVTRKIPVKVFTADWKAHGKPAGIIRDREMATFCDAAILMWDGSEWMTPALRKYFGQLDPKVLFYFVKWVPNGLPSTVVTQGREESNFLLT